MTVSKLKTILIAAGVPAHHYTFGGLGEGECYGLGPAGNSWLTYYSERGKKSPLKTLASEDEACRSMLKSMSEMTGNAALVARD